jgi:two-component system phosphate regulon sensor histidine kinase PhoR
VTILTFLLGLLVGLSLLGWQRSRYSTKLKQILHSLKPDDVDSPFSSTSQLALAITQQQRVQQQLEQQLEVYKQLLQTAPVGYLQVDDENRLIWCNNQARNLLSISSEQYLTKPRLLLELVRSYELDDLIEQTRNAGFPCQSNWTFYPVSADPTLLSEQQAYALRGYGLPLSNHQVGIFLENRQEVATLMQQRDRWASDLAHELRTPLTSIRLVAETLQTRLDPALRSWVDRLISETIRLGNLVQDLLDLGQIEQGSFHKLQLKPTDLVALIHSVWHSLEPLARKKHLQLGYSGPEQLMIQIDEPRIHRLLVNLLDNSIKYSPPDHSICVKLGIKTQRSEAGTDVQSVCLEVIDSGSGFPEKALPHVFERFYRADPSRSRIASVEEMSDGNRNVTFAQTAGSKPGNSSQPDWQLQGGSGIGLAIVRQIAEAHQGSVSARNHPETGGAWLEVRLPWPASEAFLE